MKYKEEAEIAKAAVALAPFSYTESASSTRHVRVSRRLE